MTVLCETPFLPGFIDYEQAEEIKRHCCTFRDHLKAMRNCWPDWLGPRIGDGINEMIEVHTCVVFSETHNENRYHYMAPCRLIEIGPRFEWFRAVVEYDDNAPEHCRDDNGEILRLDPKEIWPPTRLLLDISRADDL